MIDDKQANAIGAFFDPGLGYKIVRGPMTFSTSNVVPNTGISPTVGQHNHEILKEIGYNNTDIKIYENWILYQQIVMWKKIEVENVLIASIFQNYTNTAVLIKPYI